MGIKGNGGSLLSWRALGEFISMGERGVTDGIARVGRRVLLRLLCLRRIDLSLLCRLLRTTPRPQLLVHLSPYVWEDTDGLGT